MRFKFGWESFSLQGDSSRLDPLLGILSFLFPLLFSLSLVGTDLISGQQAEYLLGASTLGIVQFPGIPVYLILTKLLSWIAPHPSEIWRVEFVSLIYGAAASGLIFWIGRRLRFAPVISFASALLFFFTPVVWQQSVLPNYYTFNHLLVCVLILASLDILGPVTWHHRQWRLLFWAGLCGLAAGAHPDLLPWALTILVLGLVIGLPRHRVKNGDYAVVTLGVLLGLVLPCVYLLLRALAHKAFLNPDAFRQFAGLLQAPTFLHLLSWFAFYISEGVHVFFADHSLRGSLLQVGENFVAFFRSYPFLPIVIIGLGLLQNIRGVFLKQASRDNLGIDSTSRLFVAILPLCALGGEAVLLSRPTLATQLSLALASAFWSMKGLEYCYSILGHSDEALAKNQRLRPTVFALLVILLVPALSLVQSYPGIKNQTHHAASASGTLTQLKTWLHNLPPRAIVAFAQTDLEFGADFVQQRLSLRPDLTLMSFSRQWPEKLTPPPAWIRWIRQNQDARAAEQRVFARAWIQGIKERVLADRPVYLVLAPGKPDATLEYCLQTFTLMEASAPVAEWVGPGEQRLLSTYRIGLKPAAELPAVEPLAKPYVFDLENQWRLVSAALPWPRKTSARFSLLSFTLQWQLLQKPRSDRQLIQFWIASESGPKAIRLANGQKLFWKTQRFLGQNLDLRSLPSRSVFSETYQLAVPATLPAGQYAIYMGMAGNASAQAEETEKPGQPDYFASVCNFWVTDSGVGAASAGPGHLPTDVPLK